MKKTVLLVFVIFLGVSLPTKELQNCSTFILKAGPAIFLGHNLDEIKIKDWNKLGILIDVRNMIFYFHTGDNRKLRYFALSDSDFSAEKGDRILDMHADLSADVKEYFVDYTYERNLELTNAQAQATTPMDITIDNSGVLLKGKFYVCEGTGPFPTVLLLHGFPGNETDVLGLGGRLAEAGINALTFNYSGTHQSQGRMNKKNPQKDNPVTVNVAKGRADYIEPNVCMVHKIRA